MSTKFNLPTETVELPSKGLLYPEDSPLSNGTIEMKYMTAKEEDILTNQNYIRQGVVIDKLLESLIVTEGINYADILIGDKNAIMIAARILAYGKDYEIEYNRENIIVDLSEIDSKPLDETLYQKGKNEFEFALPFSGNVVTYKILSHGDEINIEKEIKGLKKIDKQASFEVTTRLKHMITSINGSREQKDIRTFVDTALLSKDARALRENYTQLSPDTNMVFSYSKDGVEEDVDLPITLNFFWPDI